MKFSGADYDKERDHERLSHQIARVLAVLQSGDFFTIEQLKAEIKKRYGVVDPENSLQAQIRNLRKRDNGGWKIDRVRVGNLSHYKLYGKSMKGGIE